MSIYYDPERYGLTVLGMVEEDLSYEFDMFVVWADREGNLFYATDQGCSCPSPFEDYHSVADLTPISGPDGFRSFQEALDSWNSSDTWIEDGTKTNVGMLRRQVEEHLSGL